MSSIMQEPLPIDLLDKAPDEGATLSAWLAGEQGGGTVLLVPEDDVLQLQGHLAGVQTVVLQFPKATDGRAFSQARLLRQRLGFAGHLLAAGSYMIDELPLMWRCGIDQAILPAGQSRADVQRLFGLFTDFYQGDVHETRPAFSRGFARGTAHGTLSAKKGG